MYSLEQTCGINNSDGNFSEVNADGILIFVNNPTSQQFNCGTNLTILFMSTPMNANIIFLGGSIALLC